MMEKFQASANSFHLLSDDSVPFSKRLKLCRALWVSENYTLPRKHQLMLNWVCGQISLQKESTLSFNAALKTLIQFLNSKSLSDEMSHEAAKVTMKPSLVQALSRSLNSDNDLDSLKALRTLGEILLTRNWISCALSTQFETFAAFTSSWIASAIEHISNHKGQCHRSETLLYLKHAKFLLDRSRKFFKGSTAQKKALLPFCKYLFSPLLELHYRCMAVEGQILVKSLQDTVESVMSTVLFSRENVHLYEDFGKSEAPGSKAELEDVNRRSKKFQRAKRLGSVMSVLQNISTRTPVDGELTAHSTKLFFRLFLSTAKVEAAAKVKMLQQLTKMACACPNKCDDKILTCATLNLATLHGLLEVAIEYRMYQPAVSQEVSGKLLRWLKSLLENLVDSRDASSHWVSCVSALAAVDKSIVEPRMKSILLKCAYDVPAEKLPHHKTKELIRRLVDTYVKIRQSARLVNIVIILIESAVEPNVTKMVNFETLTELVGEFGLHLGNTFSSLLSPSLVIEIWSIILKKIHDKIDVISEDNEGVFPSIECLQVLLEFFAKIVSRSPIFALWNHLTVRPQLDECVKSLEGAVKKLYQVTFSDAITQEKLKESYLTMSVIQTAVKHTLMKYAVFASGSVTVGLQKLLFQKNPEIGALSDNLTDEIDIDNLTAGDAKLSYVRLLLIKMQKLTEDATVLDIVKKSGSEKVERLNDLCDAVEERLTSVCEKLKSAMLGMKRDSVAGPLFAKALKMMVNFSSVVFRCHCPDVHEWVTDAVVSVIFGDKFSSDRDSQECVNEFFRNISYFPRPVLFALLKKAGKKLTGVPNLPTLTEGMNVHSTLSDVLSSEKFTVPCDEVQEAFSGIQNFSKILELGCVQILEIEEALPVFVYTLSLIKAVSFTLDNSEKVNGVSLLERLLKTVLKIADVHRMPLLEKCHPSKLLGFLSRLKFLVGGELRGSLDALMQELIYGCYRKTSDEPLSVFKKGYEKHKEEFTDETCDLITQRISALTSLLSFGAGRDWSKSEYGCRKRKMRTDEQIVKKLKLDPNARTTNPSQRGLFSDLEKLCRDVFTMRKKFSGCVNKSQYDLLSTTIEATTLLNSHQDSKLDLDKNVVQDFECTLQAISHEKDFDTLTSKMRFLKSCLQSQDVTFAYSEAHLRNLVSCYEKITCDQTSRQAEIELEGALFCLLQKIPNDRFQKEIFDDVVFSLRLENKLRRVQSRIRFAVFLLESGLLQELFKDQAAQNLSKSACRRFIKCLLEALNVLITKHSRDASQRDAETLKYACEAIATVLKIKWVRFQTTEICGVFSTLREVPLEKIHDSTGPEAFHSVFKSYCDVVHCIIIHHKDIGHIAAVCISAFRHLLKAATHLGKQRSSLDEKSGSLPHELSFKKSVQCAGLLEKLFQLAADNHKKDFAKCMSYIVADYICIVSSTAIVPFVKKSFTNGIYHLISMMDEYDTAMVRRALPAGVRDLFQSMFLEYVKNFKYEGFV